MLQMPAGLEFFKNLPLVGILEENPSTKTAYVQNAKIVKTTTTTNFVTNEIVQSFRNWNNSHPHPITSSNLSDILFS